MGITGNDMTPATSPTEDLAVANLSKTELQQYEVGSPSSIRQQPIKPWTQSTRDMDPVVYDKESPLISTQDLDIFDSDRGLQTSELDQSISGSLPDDLLYFPPRTLPSDLSDLSNISDLSNLSGVSSIPSLTWSIAYTELSEDSLFLDAPQTTVDLSKISSFGYSVRSAEENENPESAAPQALDTKTNNTLSTIGPNPARQDINCAMHSQVASMGDEQLKSEAGSSCWEEETDWAETTSESSLRSEISNKIKSISAFRSGEHLFALAKPMLSLEKQQVVDNIMKEFWVIFGRDWAGHVQNCTGSISVSETGISPPSDSSSTGKNQDGQKNQKNQKSNKRGRGDEPDDEPSDGEQQRPKRSRKFSIDLDKPSFKFACPYRKNNPRKYSVQSNWRPCALTPLETVARVKGHLYRHHRVFQCQRCKIIFNSSEEVDEHLKAIKGCELSLVEEAEGITINIEKRLRSRKKTSKNQTEEERWEDMYRLIFPNDIVPSPYFEPIQEDGDIPRDTELFLYEEYSRRELPRMFRGAIETIVNETTQPLEEQLRGQLTSIIQQCQDRVFSNYLRQKGVSGPSVATSGVQAISHANVKAPNRGEIIRDELAHFYHRPPSPQKDVMELPLLATSSSNCGYNGLADSGYASDILTLSSSQNSNKATNDYVSTTSSHIATSESVLESPGFTFPDNNGLEKDLFEGLETFDYSNSPVVTSLDSNIYQGFNLDETWNIEKAVDSFASSDERN